MEFKSNDYQIVAIEGEQGNGTAEVTVLTPPDPIPLLGAQ